MSARIKRLGLGPTNNPAPGEAHGPTSIEPPYVDPKLLQHLDQVFPDSVSLALRNPRGLDYAIGAREVVDYLWAVHLEQERK